MGAVTLDHGGDFLVIRIHRDGTSDGNNCQYIGLTYPFMKDWSWAIRKGTTYDIYICIIDFVGSIRAHHELIMKTYIGIASP